MRVLGVAAIAAFVTILILRVANLVDWSWWVVMFPLWIPFVLVGLAVFWDLLMFPRTWWRARQDAKELLRYGDKLVEESEKR